MFPDPTIVAENLFRNRFTLKCSMTEDSQYSKFIEQYFLSEHVQLFNEKLHTFLFPVQGTFYFSHRVLDALKELCDGNFSKIVALFQEPHGLQLCSFLDSEMDFLNTINDDFSFYLEEQNKPKSEVILHYYNYKTSPLRRVDADTTLLTGQHNYNL